MNGVLRLCCAILYKNIFFILLSTKKIKSTVALELELFLIMNIKVKKVCQGHSIKTEHNLSPPKTIASTIQTE